MRCTRRTGGWSVGAVMLLVGGLVLAGYGAGVAPAAAAPQDAHAGLPQNWDQIIPVATRFVVLSDFGGAAVRDNQCDSNIHLSKRFLNY